MYPCSLNVKIIALKYCNTAARGLTDIIICTTPEGTQCLSESADISIKPQVQPCYNIYVTFSKALSLCSACNNRDVVSKILQSTTKAEESHGDDVEKMSNI